MLYVTWLNLTTNTINSEFNLESIDIYDIIT